VLAWSSSKLTVREATGRNDGPEIESWQKLTGNSRGDAWCGSYQAGGQKACGLKFPAGAGGSYNWFKDARRTYYIKGVRGSLDSIRPGHQVGFYYANLKRIGHIARTVTPSRVPRRGNVRGWYTNEGNTGTGGGRDGAGVHLLLRASWEFHAAANWLN
jgi:hypothetical protein